MSYERKPINVIKKPMNNDYLELENAEGMPALVDSTVAMNFLLLLKTGIRNYAAALTGIADPEARKAVRTMLDQGIELHARVSDLMMDKGWFHPYQVGEQFRLDEMSARAALKVANLKLFPADSSRLGTFATPNY